MKSSIDDRWNERVKGNQYIYKNMKPSKGVANYKLNIQLEMYIHDKSYIWTSMARPCFMGGMLVPSTVVKFFSFSATVLRVSGGKSYGPDV